MIKIRELLEDKIINNLHNINNIIMIELLEGLHKFITIIKIVITKILLIVNLNKVKQKNRIN